MHKNSHFTGDLCDIELQVDLKQRIYREYI